MLNLFYDIIKNLLRHRAIKIFIFIWMIALLSACAAFDALIPTPAATPRPTLTAISTPTIIWFPPSATASPQAFLTRAPTPELRPNVGKIIIQDDFASPALWDIAASDEASASINQNRLNLAAQSGIYMLSLRRETILADYYAELSATPSLCLNADSYGLLIRASAVAYYRFSLTCNGAVSAERISGSTRQLLQKPIPSGDAPLGAGNVRIGVWAVKDDIRLFLNGRYQFSINNANYPSGALGVFVNAAGDTPVVVSFSDLVVREIK